MVRVKRIIFSYFEFFDARLTWKRMKYIGSLFILVFVQSKASPKHFLHVFKNRGHTSLPLLLNPHLLICSTKVHFFQFTVHFLSASVLSKYSPKLLSGTSLHTFVEKGIREGEEKLFQLLSKLLSICLNPIPDGLFQAAHGWRGKAPLPKICQTYLTIMKLGTLTTYLKKIIK